MAQDHSTAALQVADAPKELERLPLVLNNRSLGWITNTIAGIVEGKTPKWWWFFFVRFRLCATLCRLLRSRFR